MDFIISRLSKALPPLIVLGSFLCLLSGCTEAEVTGTNGSGDNSSNAIDTVNISCGSQACLRGPDAEALDPNDFDYDDVSEISKAALYLYFLVNGPSNSYSLSPIDNISFESSNGYLALVNAEISTINSILSENQIGSCEDISTEAANITATVSSEDYTINFSESSVGLSDVFDLSDGSEYQKRLTVLKDDETHMLIDLLCAEDGILESTRVRVDVTEASVARKLLVEFQSNSTDDHTQVDFYLSSSRLNVSARFEKENSSDFSFTSLYVPQPDTLSDNQGPVAVAATGQASDNVSRLAIHADGNDAIVSTNDDVATAWTETCYFLTDKSVSGLCQFGISNEIVSDFLAGDGSWTIQNTANLNLSNL